MFLCNKLLVIVFVCVVLFVNLVISASSPYTVFNSEHSESSPSALHARVRRQNAQCTGRTWACQNGQCIPRIQLCDGTRECADGSDETVNACSTNRCAGYAFRCAYGACVSGDAACDGKTDCADNSDELRPECPGNVATSKPNKCRRGQFSCDSGQCVTQDKACDGKADCADSSDETLRRCTGTKCQSYAFRCAYGACVSGDATCDQVLDCADGSDETQEMCGRPPPIGSTKPTQPTRPTRPTPSPPVIGPTGSPAEPSGGSCLVPPVPEYGSFTTGSESLRPGTYAPEYSVLIYKCRPGYKIRGEGQVFCVGGSWTDTPECQRPCKPLISSSVDIYCHLNNQPVPCNETMAHGTKADLSCKKAYQRFPPSNTRITCTDDGSWDYSLIRCTPDCGTRTPSGTAFVIGGTEVGDLSDFPWHGGIYRKDPSRTKNPQQICGGSIVNERTIISAAHCFYNPGAQRPYEKDNYAVAIGKLYRDWQHPDDIHAQFSDVAELVMPETYDDISGNYADDIAFVRLVVYIKFTALVKPVCIDWNFKGIDYGIEEGVVGHVAGWGLTAEDGFSAPKLKTIGLPAVSRTECVNKSPPDFRPYLRSDKFCAGYLNGSSVCKGDSGGGLCFEQQENNLNVFYLRGIVSVGPGKGESCNAHQYTAFTNVLAHISWLITKEANLGSP